MEVEDDAVIASTERFLSEAEAKTAAARYAENAEEALFERTKEKNLEGVFTASQSYRWVGSTMCLINPDLALPSLDAPFKSSKKPSKPFARTSPKASSPVRFRPTSLPA